MNERYFGRIIFPNTTQPPIEGVWLVIEERQLYVEIPFPISTDLEWPIVLGEFSSASGFNKVTLIDARLSFGLHGAGGSYRKMIFNSILKGIHIPNLEQLVFKHVILRSSSLLNWFTVYHTVDKDKWEESRSLTIPPPLTVFENRFRDFHLQFSLEFGGEFGYHNISINHLCFISLEYENPVILDKIRNDIFLLRKFVIFFTNSNPNFEKVTVARGENEYIEWLIRFPYVDQNRFSSNIQTPYSIIQPFLNEILQLWFEKEEFQYVLNLLLETYFNTDLSIPRHYQNMCVALESFHGNFIQKNLPVSDEVVNNRNYILGLLRDAPDILKWFKKESNYWLDPKFVDRLNSFKDLLNQIFGNTIDGNIDDLITKIKQTRNEITHRGMVYRRFDPIELILVSKSLEFAIRLSILQNFGVEIDGVNNSLIKASSDRIKHLAWVNNYNQDSDQKNVSENL